MSSRTLQRRLYIDMVERLAFGHAKMAFLAGPRQVGKTTLGRQILARSGSGLYYLWDDPVFRRRWIADPQALLPQSVDDRLPVVMLDELHKAPRWKRQLKGLYDLRGDEARFLVTGSARLDIFRRGGDSLLGRYFLFRMHPFSLGELARSSLAPGDLAAALGQPLGRSARRLSVLLEHGGFPEPYMARDPVFTTLWRRTRTGRLIREDLRDIQRINELSLLETVAQLLPGRVGSLFSVKSLAEEIEVSQPTVKRWLGWLSRVYYAYRVSPYVRNVARSLKKQPKVYLWDWAEVPEPGPRFENLVAGHLLKATHAWTDMGLGSFELRFVRDKEKREVDFLLLRDRKPWMLVEAKRAANAPTPALVRFGTSLQPEITLQVVAEPGVHEWFPLAKGARGHLVSADAFLRLLP